MGRTDTDGQLNPPRSTKLDAYPLFWALPEIRATAQTANEKQIGAASARANCIDRNCCKFPTAAIVES